LFCVDHTQAKRCKEKTIYIYRTREEGFWKVFRNLTIPLCHYLKPLWIKAYGTIYEIMVACAISHNIIIKDEKE
jgi:hypothetical protein